MKIRISSIGFFIFLLVFFSVIFVQFSMGYDKPLPNVVWTLLVFLLVVIALAKLDETYSKVKNLNIYVEIEKYHKLRTSLKKYINDAKSSSYGDPLVDEGMENTIQEIEQIVNEVDNN